MNKSEESSDACFYFLTIIVKYKVDLCPIQKAARLISFLSGLSL